MEIVAAVTIGAVVVVVAVGLFVRRHRSWSVEIHVDDENGGPPRRRRSD